MAYQATLSAGRTLFVENNGNQTQITLQSGSLGQQQSQSTGFTTGAWQQEPLLHKTPHGIVLQVEGSEGHFYFQVHGSSIYILDEPPHLRDSEMVSLQETADMPQIKPMKPMEPMESMKPMPPMEMNMGNMHMRMGNSEAQTATKTSQNSNEAPARFCTQCGTPAQADDKFCEKCGHKLRG
jgi:hypothetical protein